MGDDVVDLPVMLQVGRGDHRGRRARIRAGAGPLGHAAGGGRGAVREVCDAILQARGDWDAVTRRYFSPEPL